MTERRTVAVDLDGTLAEYRPGDFREGRIGPPLPGAREAMQAFRDAGFEIVIHTARCGSHIVDSALKRAQIAADISVWLKHNEIPNDGLWRGEGKPAAWAYVDDAAVHFDGDWPATVDRVLVLKREAK